MRARPGSWWQKIRQHLLATVLISLSAMLVALVIAGGYKFNWGWTGFGGSNKSSKTLWDWMQLLFIPVVLAVAGFWFNHRERKAAELRAEAEREIEQQRAEADRANSFDNQHEAALKDYFDKMSELLLEKHLRESKEKDEVRTIARVRSLTTLSRLDSERKRSLLQFLQESGLIDKDNGSIGLYGANLSYANLSNLDLNRANLNRVDLSHANMSNSYLYDANLVNADLNNANLSHANLNNADLSNANLFGANLSHADLRSANLRGADLRDAKLIDATLRDANLLWAKLRNTDLKDANLINANLSGTNLSDTNLIGTDLSNAHLTGTYLDTAYLGGNMLNSST